MRALPLAAGVLLAVAASHAPAWAAWSSPHVAGPAGTEVRAPAVARTPAGDVLTVWVRAPRAAPPGSGEVMVMARSPRGVWGPARRLSGPGTGAPAVAMASDGGAAVAFGIRDVLHVARRAGRDGAWIVERVTSGAGHVVDVRLGFDAARRVTVAWSARDGDEHVVRLARRGVGVTGTWRALGDAVATDARPALEVASDGRAHATWAHDGTVRVVSLGGERPAAVALGEGGEQIPALAVAVGGRVVVGWKVRLPGGTTVVAAAERRPAGDWRTLGDLGVGESPTVAVGPRGDAAVVWTVSDAGGERASIEALVRRGSGPWRSIPVVSRTTCSCRYLLEGAAVDGAGGVLVAWRRASRTGGGVVAVSARHAADTRWRSVALRPAPPVGGVALGVDRVVGAAVAWAPATVGAAGPVTRVRAGAT